MASPGAIGRAARALAGRLAGGGALVVSTGAGMSRESGIPTFRGAEGVWRHYRAEDVATPEALYADPSLAWEFHDHLRALVAAAQPNAGHLALAGLAVRLSPTHPVHIVTQNVDRLHEAAGSRDVIHLHGDIRRVICTVCGFADDDYPVPAADHPPLCECGGLLRPDVVLFGEQLPAPALEGAWRLAEGCAAMLVVGTSANVQPAASLPFAALEHDAMVIEVNPDETPLTPYTRYSLGGGAATVLPELLEVLGDAICPDRR
jgi:NAD-dependent deacetylase